MSNTAIVAKSDVTSNVEALQPIAPNKSLVPIESELIAAGLVDKSDLKNAKVTLSYSKDNLDPSKVPEELKSRVNRVLAGKRGTTYRVIVAVDNVDIDMVGVFTGHINAVSGASIMFGIEFDKAFQGNDLDGKEKTRNHAWMPVWALDVATMREALKNSRDIRKSHTAASKADTNTPPKINVRRNMYESVLNAPKDSIVMVMAGGHMGMPVGKRGVVTGLKSKSQSGTEVLGIEFFIKPTSGHDLEGGIKSDRGLWCPVWCLDLDPAFLRKDVTTKHIPEVIDPMDVLDENGYSPRMREWLNAPGITDLLSILRHQRPMGSSMETTMIMKHIYPLIHTVEGISMVEERSGNIIVDLGNNEHGVLWSCHTDTVHGDREQRPDQELEITRKGYLQLRRGSGTCLGADDGTGVWLMIEMIKAGVAGRYVFHYGEERGCIGSRALLKERPDLLEGMRFAIAFDRQGTSDVITHQRGSRCCSDAFALSIAEQLPGSYSPCRGVFTDTAIYTEVIPECTNLSVGYHGQHGSGEVQNIPHLLLLRDAMVKIDPSRFVCQRDPKAKEVSTFRSQGSYGSWGGLLGDDDYADSWESAFGSNQTPTSRDSKGYSGREEVEEIERVFGRNQSLRASRRNTALRIINGERKPATRSRSSSRLVENAKVHRLGDEAFRDDAPPAPASLRELAAHYTQELASALEDDGFVVGDFWPNILSVLGYRKQ